MTYKDKTIVREHARLTVKIKRWKEQGKDISELLAQREALKDQTNKRDITDKTDTTKLDLTNRSNKDITKKDKTPEKLTQISHQLETLLNLAREQSQPPVNHEPLLTQLQTNQQKILTCLEQLITEKLVPVKPAPTPVKKKPQISLTELVKNNKPPRQPKQNQPIKVDIAELERTTGLTKNWKSPAWKKAYKDKYNELYNKLPSTLEKKREWWNREKK